MATHVKFPIRTKLLLLLLGTTLASTGAYLALATKLFRDDKAELVYELNASNVKTLAAEVEAVLEKFADKAKLLTQGHREGDWLRAVFDSDPDLVAFTLYNAGWGSTDWPVAASFRNPGYFKLYSLDEKELDRARAAQPIPFARVLERNTLVMNSSTPGGVPLLTLALAISIRGQQTPSVAVVDVRLDRLAQRFTERGLAETYLVDDEGRVIVHSDKARILARASLAEIPIVKQATESAVALRLSRFDWGGERWLGAHASVSTGRLSVISQVRESEAFRAASRLTEKSILFALIVVTASILLALWMARSFTQPVQSLVEAAERVSRWDFTRSVHVTTRDEIAALARAFNSMSSDLARQHELLENSRNELELKVKERTSALESEKKLAAQIQDTLLKTTRLASLGELAGSAAHEILNPLNNMNIRVERMRKQQGRKDDLELLRQIVSGWSESFKSGGIPKLSQDLSKDVDSGKKLVEEDLENLSSIAQDELRRAAEQEEGAEFLSREITRVTRIVNSMRALSRVGGERRPVDVHAPLDETAVTLADALAARKIALVREYSSELRERFSVVADKDELVQVFSNLVRNAMHAVESAGRRAGEIRIRTSRQGDRLEVRIVDNGGGIEAEHLGRIFEPNFTTKSLDKGTGLGLSISRRLVRAFGGDIEVESTRPGEGTTFLVWLPANLV
jgi:signal transduction histidine kinase